MCVVMGDRMPAGRHNGGAVERSAISLSCSGFAFAAVRVTLLIAVALLICKVRDLGLYLLRDVRMCV